ncbi:MAG: ImmA/IrrE family metallo-endopeptidase [Candidatus Eisenbacteria sp.]|nr:ImmA/IrrE family metallo-endopeptidase [Candidatus Eisenbacteria bacterium]
MVQDVNGDPNNLHQGGDAPEIAPEAEEEFRPLPTDWDDRAIALAEEFISPRILSQNEQASLERFSHICLRFAHVERCIQGEILCEIPAHLSVLRRDQNISLLEEVESLANAERENMDLPKGPIENLVGLFDDRGIKVIESVQGKSNLAGAFMFQEDTGPALLTPAPVDSPVGRFIVAHEYCHLLADVDPYESRFCPHGAQPGQDALAGGGRLLELAEFEDALDETALPETRADLFARCFLLPREHFVQTLRDFDQGGAAGFHLDRLADVAFYYGVSVPVVLNRLVDIEILRIGDARAMAEAYASRPHETREQKGLDRKAERSPDRKAERSPDRKAERSPDRKAERSPDRKADLGLSAKPGVCPQDASPDPSSFSGAACELPKRFVDLSLALFLKKEVSQEQLSVLLDAAPSTVDLFLSWIEYPAKSRQADKEAPKGKRPDGDTPRWVP